MAITERDQIRLSMHRHAAPAEYLRLNAWHSVPAPATQIVPLWQSQARRRCRSSWRPRSSGLRWPGRAIFGDSVPDPVGVSSGRTEDADHLA